MQIGKAVGMTPLMNVVGNLLRLKMTPIVSIKLATGLYRPRVLALIRCVNLVDSLSSWGIDGEGEGVKRGPDVRGGSVAVPLRTLPC